jgi:hypothetical protein
MVKQPIKNTDNQSLNSLLSSYIDDLDFIEREEEAIIKKEE